jgi:hypothetical protein
MFAQPGCGNTSNGSLTLSNSWQNASYSSGTIPYWSFNGVSGVTYDFSLCSNSEDSYIRIYNSSYSQVASNDDNGPHCSGTPASISWSCTANGTYYVSAAHYSCNSFSNSGNMAYKDNGLHLACGDLSLGALAPSASWQNAAYSAGTKPYWSFTANAGEICSFSLCSNSEDSYLRIYNSSGTQLASNDDNGPYCSGTPASIDWACTTTGTYYVSAAHYSCNSFTNSGNMAYTKMAAPSCGSLYSGKLTPTTSSQNASYTSGTTPYWTFDAELGNKYVFSLCSNSEDSYLRIYNSSGTQVAYNDDNGPHCSGSPASITWDCTSAGRYIVAASNYSCDPFDNSGNMAYYYIAAVPGKWAGRTSTNWATASNWDDYNVPTTSMDVSIPSGCAYYPNLGSGITGDCRNIDILSGASITISGGRLNVTGTTGDNGYNGVDNYGTFNISSGILDVAKSFENRGGTANFSGGSSDMDEYLYNMNSYSSVMNISGGTIDCANIPNYEGVINHTGGTINDYGYYREYDTGGGNYYGSGTAVLNLRGSSYIRLYKSGSYFNHVNIIGTYNLTSDCQYDMDINGNITITGSFDWNDNTSRVLRIAGNWDSSSGSVSYGTHCYFDGATNATINTGGNAHFNYLRIYKSSSSYGISLSGNARCTHLILDEGYYDINGHTHTSNGVLYAYSGSQLRMSSGTIDLNGAAGYSYALLYFQSGATENISGGDIYISGYGNGYDAIDVDGNFTPSGGNVYVDYTGSTTVYIDGTGTCSFYNLYLSRGVMGRNVQLQRNLSVTNSLNINSGTLNVAGYTVGVAGSSGIDIGNASGSDDASLYMASGTINITSSSSDVQAILINSDGRFDFDGGTVNRIYSISDDYNQAIRINNGGVWDQTNGTLNLDNQVVGYWWGTYIDAGGTLQISGGNYYNDSYFYNYGTVNLTGSARLFTGSGSSYTDNYGYYYNYGTTTINGASALLNVGNTTYRVNFNNQASGDVLTVSDGMLNVTGNFYNYTGSVSNLSGGEIETAYEVYNTGTFNISDGMLDINDPDDYDGFQNQSGGQLTQTGGTIAVVKAFMQMGGRYDLDDGVINAGQYFYPNNGYNSITEMTGGTMNVGGIPNYEGTFTHTGGVINNSGYYREYDADGGMYVASGTAQMVLSGSTSTIRLLKSGTQFNDVLVTGYYTLTNGESTQDMDVNGDLEVQGTFRRYDIGVNMDIEGSLIVDGGIFHNNAPGIIDVNDDIYIDDGTFSMNIACAVNTNSDLIVANDDGVGNLIIYGSGEFDVEGNVEIEGIFDCTGVSGITPSIYCAGDWDGGYGNEFGYGKFIPGQSTVYLDGSDQEINGSLSNTIDFYNIHFMGSGTKTISRDCFSGGSPQGTNVYSGVTLYIPYALGWDVDVNYGYYIQGTLDIDGGAFIAAAGNGSGTNDSWAEGSVLNIHNDGAFFSSYDTDMNGATINVYDGTSSRIDVNDDLHLGYLNQSDGFIRNGTDAYGSSFTVRGANLTGGKFYVNQTASRGLSISDDVTATANHTIYIQNVESTSKPSVSSGISAQLGNLEINENGKLVFGDASSSLEIVGDLTIASGKTFNANGCDFSLKGDWIQDGTFTANGNQVTFNGASEQEAYLNSVGDYIFWDLVINNTSTSANAVRNMDGYWWIENDFSLEDGTFEVVYDASAPDMQMIVHGDCEIASGGTLNFDEGTNDMVVFFDGDYTNNGTIVCTSYTEVNFDGDDTQNINAGGTGDTKDFGEVKFTGSGTNVLQSNMEIDGSLTVDNGTLQINNYDLYTLNGYSGNNAISDDAEVVLSGSSAYWRLAASNNGNLYCYGTLTINDGKVTSGSGLELDATGVINQSGGSIGIGDNFTINGDFNGDGGTVRGKSDSDDWAPQIINNVAGTYFNDFKEFGSTANPSVLSGSYPITVNGDLEIPAGDALNANGVALYVGGEWLNQGGFVTGNNTVTFDGSEAQTISTNNLPFYNVIINNTALGSADITLSDNLIIDNNIVLTNGVINTGANRVIFGNSATVSGGSTHSFIDGEMQYAGAFDFKYPCGDVIARDLNNDGIDEDYAVYSPIEFGTLSGTPTNVVEYNYDEPEHDWWFHGDNIETSMHHVSNREWWDVNSTGDIGNVKIYIVDNVHAPGAPCPHGLCNGDIPTNFLPSDLSITVWSNQGWIDLGQVTYSGNHDNGSLLSALAPPTGVKSKAGQYAITLGSKSGMTPLPVELMSFTAVCNGEYVDLNWSTATEINNDKFIVQRSNDMRTFNAIAEISGAGNTTEVQFYSLTDNEPIGDKAYYRLRQVDFDGTYNYSNVVAVECSSIVDAPQVELYPNPVKDILHIVGEGLPELTTKIVVMDVLGKIVFETQVESYAIGFHKEIDVSSLKPAMYFVKVYSGTFSKTYKIDVEK